MLQQILDHKRHEVQQQMEQVPMEELQVQAENMPPCRDFAAAIKKSSGVQVIAEVKHRSPSKGLLRENFNPVELAVCYAQAGAAAISVLTDNRFFGGRLQYLEEIKKNVSLPLLRKDFIIHPYQMYQSKVRGADAVLLIVAALDDEELSKLHNQARLLGMTALVEVHDEIELQRALDIGANIIGINNRNLSTFVTDINTTYKLMQSIKEQGITVVSESGISTSEDMANMARHNINAVLVGEALVTSPDPGLILSQLLSGGDYPV